MGVVNRRPHPRVHRGRRSESGRGPESPLEKKPGPHQPPPYTMYPPYSYPYDPYARGYPMYPPPHGHPYSFPPPQGHRFGGHVERGTKRGYSEREQDDLRRPDFHPWPHDTEHRPKRRWSEEGKERDRPKILSKGENWREGPASPDSPVSKGEKVAAPALRWGGSGPSDATGAESPTKHHVTFADMPQPKIPSQEEEPESSSPAVPAMRSQPKKIMLRKMGESRDGESAEKQEYSGSGKVKERSKDPARESGTDGESVDTTTPDGTKPRPMAWNRKERGPVSSKTLYEPEGKKSEAKFRKYQHEAGEHQARERGAVPGKREKGGPSPATTPNEVQPPCELPDVGREKPEEKVPLRRTASAGERGREGEGERWAEPRREHVEHPPRRQDSSGRMPRDRERPERTRGRRDRERPDREREREREKKREGDGQTDHRREEHQEVNVQGATKVERERVQRHTQPSELEQQKSQKQEHNVQPSTEHREGERRRRAQAGSPQHQREGRAAEQERVDWDTQQRERPGRSQRLPSRGDAPRARDERRPQGRGGHQTESSGRKERQGSAADVGEAEAVGGSDKGTGKASERLSTDQPAVTPGGTHQRPAGKRPPLLQDPPQAQRRAEREQSDSRTERRQREPLESRRDSFRRSDRRKGGSGGGRGDGGRERGGRNPPRGRGDGGQEEGEAEQREEGLQLEAVEKEEDRGRPTERGRGDRRGRDRDRRDRGRASGKQAESVDEAKPPGPHEVQPLEQSKREGGRGRDRRRDRRERAERGAQPDMPGRDSESVRKPVRESGQPSPTDRRGGRRGRERGRDSRRGRRPETGYGDLVDEIDSASDWEEQIELDEKEHRLEEPKGERAAASVSESQTSASSLQHQARGERRPRRRDEGREPPEGSEVVKKDPAHGVGRGRGRSGEQARERAAKPGGQRRGAGRLGGREEATQEVRPEHRPGTASQERGAGQRGEGKGAAAEKQSAGHKQHDFEKYDLNSHKVAIVDDIRNQPEEQESTSEFVEVTSKKAQKEKVKKEKEKQRQEVERRKEEEDRQKKSRKSAPAKSPSHNTSHPLLKPSTAWGSKSEVEGGTQPSIWGTAAGAISSTEWHTPLCPSTSAAPGSQLKVSSTGPVSSLSSWHPSVGVIGEGLQGKPATAVMANQSSSSASSADNPSYSLFPLSSVLGSVPILVPPPYASSGRMLSAAVDMKLSQEHLPPASGDQEPAARSEAGTEGQANPVQRESQAKPEPVKMTVTSDVTKAVESSEVHLAGSHGRGKSSLPPRLQPNKPTQQQGGGVGRGRGQRRGKGGVGRGERVAGGEQKEQSKQEDKRESRPKEPRGRGKEKVRESCYMWHATAGEDTA